MIQPIPNVNPKEMYWFDENPILSHFFSALSVLFPYGERYFQKSVSQYKERFPSLKSQIVQFCKQEANHTSLHKKLNHSFDNRDVLRKLEAQTGTIIENCTSRMSNKNNLLITACLEHITAALAEQLIERKDLHQLMENEMLTAWLYHAYEESSDEHRQLAFKLYKQIGGSDWYRKLMMVPVTLGLMCVVIRFWAEIIDDDPKASLLLDLKQSLHILFGFKNGFITGIIPEYLRWFK